MRLTKGLWAAGLLFGGMLYAQDSDNQNTDIVVTATKEPAPADTLPVPVIVLGPEELAGKQTVSQALASTLAVRFQDLIPGESALTAPGFGENGFGRVALLLDGVSQDNPDMAAPPLNLVPVFALDRIEIVKGPASALYGSGAAGGAVNLVTKTPRTLTVQTAASVEAGGSNRQSAAFGLPVGDGGLLLSLARDQGLPTRDRSDSGRYQGWTKFSLPLGDQQVAAWAAFTNSDTQLPGSLTQPEYKSDPDQADNQQDSTTLTETSGGASWSWSNGDWKLSVPVSGFVRNVTFTTVSALAYDGSPYTGTELFRGQFEPTIAVQGTWLGADSSLTAGVSAFLDRLTANKYPADNFGSPSATIVLDRWTASVWNRGQLAWDNRWFLSAALRVETSRTRADSPDIPAVDGTKDFWPVAGEVGLTWLPASAWKLGLQLSRVYRYPFTDEMVLYSAYGPGAAFLDGVDAEVGHGSTLSASWKGGAWEATASGTLLRMENEVGLNSDYQPANLGPTWHSSTLTSVSWKPVSGPTSVTLGAEYTFELARFASGVNDGKIVPLIPEHRGRLTAKAASSLGGIEAGWTVTSSFFESGDEANTGKQIPGRSTLDADTTVYLGSQEWALNVYGRNLTDDRTPSFVSYGGWYPTEGRVLGVSLTWTF